MAKLFEKEIGILIDDEMCIRDRKNGLHTMNL